MKRPKRGARACGEDGGGAQQTSGRAGESGGVDLWRWKALKDGVSRGAVQLK